MSIFNHNWEKSRRSEQGQLRHLVIIAGYYGFDNLGDEAILEELLNELNSLCGRENIVVLSHNPDKTASIYQIKAINRWHWFDCLKLLRKAKLLVSGGGGLFQDRTGLGSVIFYSAQILLARLCGTKVLIYAQGLGPLRNIFSKELTRLAFGQSNKITVRDSNSLAMVKEWGLAAQLTADPVWSLPSSALPEPAREMLETMTHELSKLPETKGINAKRMIIGLSLRDDPLLQNYHLEFLAKGIADAVPDQSAILLLPLQAQRDQKPLQTIEQFLSQSGLRTHWLDPSILAKPSQWLTLIENIDILIGMRFHALLLALKSGKPVIGIAYDQKVSQLLSDFKQPSLSLGADQYQCEAIWPQTINSAIAAKEDLANMIKGKLITTKELADKNIKSLAEILEVGTAGDVTSIYG